MPQDPDHWEQPLAFLPERFLERSGDSWRLLKKDRFVPYGFGRRVCMGEALARDTLLIFFSTLVKHLRSYLLITYPFILGLTSRPTIPSPTLPITPRASPSSPNPSTSASSLSPGCRECMLHVVYAVYNIHYKVRP